jgi:hypothetical protein
MSPSLQLSGSLSDIPVPDIARLLHSTRRTGRLVLVMDEATGAIYFERGDIVDSQASQTSGLDAIRHLGLFNRGTFTFEDNVDSPIRGLTEIPTMELIRVLETRMQESRQIFELMPAENEIARYLGGAIPNGFEVNAAELAVAMKASSGTLGTAHLAHVLQLDLTMVRYTLARFRAIGLVEIREDTTDPWHAPAAPVAAPEHHMPEEHHDERPEVPGAPSTAPSSQPRYWRGRRMD